LGTARPNSLVRNRNNSAQTVSRRFLSPTLAITAIAAGALLLTLNATAKDNTMSRTDLVHANLKGLPPVTLINAQIDPLRSDGDMLADALKKAGVKVEHKMYPGTTHEFFGMAAVVADAKDAQALAGRNLKRAFEGK